MKRFIEGEGRTQVTLLPECLDDFVVEDNPVRVIYVYGYLNGLQSSRRLERETQRNVELMWLTGRLTPDFKTIADFRKDNGTRTGLRI
jgi:transposase